MTERTEPTTVTRSGRTTALSASYHRGQRRIFVKLSTGAELSFRPQEAPALVEAAAAQLATIQIAQNGLSLYFPALDTEVYLPSMDIFLNA
jgi:hypothetical protein